MPHCINDHTRSYKGDEPSPKGLGYCAHSEPVGSRKQGQDGRVWVVKEDKNDRKSWKPTTRNKPGSKSSKSTGRRRRRAMKPTSSYKKSCQKYRSSQSI